MGLITGGLSFRRYRTAQKLPDDFREQYTENINQFGFREDLAYRSKEPLIGWVNIFNADDSDFTLNTYLFDHYIALSMRADKKAVNGRFFQILLERRFREVMNERKLDRLGKKHKEEIKEALEEELLSKSLPAVNTYDVVWDINSGEVLTFATSDTTLDYIQGLMHDTFGTLIHPERMVDWLAERWDWSTIETRTDAHIPGGALEKGLEPDEDGWHQGNPLKGREFTLGSEFLTWLWHESEARDGYFDLSEPASESVAGSFLTIRDLSDTDDDTAPGSNQAETSSSETMESASPESADPSEVGEEQLPSAQAPSRPAPNEDEEITLWLDTKMILRDLDDVEVPGVTTMVGEAPSTSPEAKATLHSGKRPVEARIGIRRGEHEWYLMVGVGTNGLELRNLKLPIEVKDGEEEKIYERMFLLDFLTSTVKKLFRRFFEVRTSDDWPGLIEAWIEPEAQS